MAGPKLLTFPVIRQTERGTTGDVGGYPWQGRNDASDLPTARNAGMIRNEHNQSAGWLLAAGLVFWFG